jgi:hypothetical protein
VETSNDIQNKMDKSLRRQNGAHYTERDVILNVINPLFMDDLRQYKGNLQERVSNIKIFDPACGCGNFFHVVSEEIKSLGVEFHNSQLYGIEVMEDVAKECLKSFPGANIHTGSALSVDWDEVCPSTNKSETYICGNPPYLGSGGRSDVQNEEQDSVMKGRIKKSARSLDFVCNWFVLAHAYCSEKTSSKFAFVSTNSIVQGSHVPTLWPYLLSDSMEIGFAYPSFKWSNMAGEKAGVSCVIVGMQHKDVSQKRLFLEDGEKCSENINPYLMPAPNVWVTKSSKPISKAIPEMTFGNMANDGGHLHITNQERIELIRNHPEAESLIRLLIGSQEALKGIERYCLWIQDSDISIAENIPFIANRIASVKNMRKSSTRLATNNLASTPHKFGECRQTNSQLTLVIPRVSSGERKFLATIMCENGEIVNDSAFMLPDAEPWHMAILSSTLHRCWLGAVSGKLGDGYRYSNTLVWNTFPMAELSDDDKLALNKTAQNILNARHYHPDLTLGDMYNPGKMGPELLTAHKENDRVLEKIFRDKPFKSDEDRLSHLFNRYKDMTDDQ